MRLFYKVFLNLAIIVSFLVIFYAFTTNHYLKDTYHNGYNRTQLLISEELQATLNNKSVDDGFISNRPRHFINVWFIFSKVRHRNSPLKAKLITLLTSLFKHSSVNLWFSVICDETSQVIAEEVINETSGAFDKHLKVSFYNIKNITDQLSEIIKTMQPYFTSSPGTYYSDALFFLSLGLHFIAPISQKQAIMLDVDIKFKGDIALLSKEFDNFSDKAVIGIAPELTPVYQHILYTYRTRHKHTPFGNPLSKGGFPGVNSGVLLLYFDRLRSSQEYNYLLSSDVVRNLTQKYSFKGHLGDQDLYTLIGMEYPYLLHLISCQWNRQLCEWWSYHGYRDVFDLFSSCKGPVMLYHGNCNSPIPRD